MLKTVVLNIFVKIMVHFSGFFYYYRKLKRTAFIDRKKRHYDRLHWELTPLSSWWRVCSSEAAEARDHQLQNKNKSVTSLLLCVLRRVPSLSYSDLSDHIKERQYGIYCLLLRIWNLRCFHIKSNNAIYWMEGALSILFIHQLKTASIGI